MCFFSPSIRRFSRWGRAPTANTSWRRRQNSVGRGAEVIETDRGGDVTFHGPGQLVAYPIVHLAGWKKDVHAYLRALEAAAIETAAWFGTAATRREGLTGVWCCAEGAPRKLASIGVRVSRWVASHGLAFNVTTDLGWFSHIVPCGIRDSATTSLELETGRSLTCGRGGGSAGGHARRRHGTPDCGGAGFPRRGVRLLARAGVGEVPPVFRERRVRHLLRGHPPGAALGDGTRPPW